MERTLFLVVLFCLCLTNSVAFALAAPATQPSGESGRRSININPGWRFWLGDAPAEAVQAGFDDAAWDIVSLPHTHEVFPANLDGFKEHGRNIGWYRRVVNAPQAWRGKRVAIEFQGAMQSTRVWVNGVAVGEHAVSGYDSFDFDLTPHLRIGQPNIIAVRVDNTPNPDMPPDGRKIDFIQFGGLYRDVRLHVTDPLHITFPWNSARAGVRVTLPEASAESAVARVETTVRNDGITERGCTLLVEIRDREGSVVASARQQQKVAAGAEATFDATLPAVSKPRLWSPADAYLYSVHTVALGDDGTELDRVITRLGVRWFAFDKSTGFSLNGQPLKLIGANRHQTWPFIGNAVPNGLHRRDAEQMKAMGLNWVRLSHYPHDPDFLDALDELGLLALEEGPTWMGVGGPRWVRNLHESFRAMIRRDRNHPSIIMWNACINHSRGDEALAAIAKEEDPTRPRGQVDVPAPMDFRHTTVSGGSALTIEHTGHTFPTFRGDREVKGKFTNSWEGKNKSPDREYDLAQRHWEHTNAAYLKRDNSGVAVWAMYDYNTFHNASGAIAPHGVFDLFRLPKYSYWWHRAELTDEPLAYLVRISGERACVFANGERVRLSQDLGDGYVEVATRGPDEVFVLRHPPFHFDVDPRALSLRAESLKGEQVVATHEWHKPGEVAALTLEADRAEITADGSDLSRLIVSAVDGRGTSVDASEAAVKFTIDGPGQLVGENPVPLRAGKMIVLVQSSFAPGEITVTASADGLKPARATVRTVPAGVDVDVPADVVGRSPTRSSRQVMPPAVVLAEQPWLAFPAKRAQRNQWVESDAIMIPGDVPTATVEIRGGEYRVYTSPWTSEPGRVQAGDAVFVRVRAGGEAGDVTWVDLRVGDRRARFEVTAEPPPRRPR